MELGTWEDCFGCGGWVGPEGRHWLKHDRRGDGHPASEAKQCAFCGRPVSDEDVQAVVAEKFETMSVDGARSVPICYIQRFLGHRKAVSTLNYVGGINNVIRQWSQDMSDRE